MGFINVNMMLFSRRTAFPSLLGPQFFTSGATAHDKYGKNTMKPTYGVGCVVDYGQEQQRRQYHKLTVAAQYGSRQA